MEFGSPEFVLAIIAMSYAAWLATSWIRARHGYPLENEWGGVTAKGEGQESTRQIALLGSENDKLRGQVIRLEERIAVLERIATDPSKHLSDEIEHLR